MILNSFRLLFTVFGIFAVLYLLAIMPRLLNRPDRTAFQTKLFAHRGLHDNRTGAPENSMPAFRRAVQAGYGIELDVQTTRDHVPVVFHDFTLERMCGVPGKVSDYTFEELRRFTLGTSDEQIPSFREFLDEVNGAVPLIVEYKVEARDLSVCRICAPMLRNYPGVYCIESFNPLVLLWYRKHAPEVMRGQLSDAFLRSRKYWGRHAPGMFLLQMLMENFLTGPDFIAYNHENQANPSRKLCRGLYRIGAAAWTIRSREQLERAKRHFDVFIFDSFLPEEADLL
nr:glycerophosphodiester phosphodiesterase family protein [Lachnoclostridium sp. Marseille-P6806]